MNYILDDQHNIIQVDLETWSHWMAKASKTDGRRVAITQDGEIMISTVFLGVDHNWGGGPPILFETMVFGGIYDQEQERYHTWAEAEEGHKYWVQKVTEAEAMRRKYAHDT